MDQRLSDVLSGREANYLLPFFWQCGDHREKLPGQIEEIYQSGARAFCVESRTHEDFCGEGWWADMEIILSEAEKRGMQVWILDDKHFPTGYANGALAKEHPELAKWFLREEHVDVMGPMRGCTLLLNPTEDLLLGVYAYRRTGEGEELCGAPIRLTEQVSGRWICFDAPEGCWRVFFLYQSRRGGSPGQEQYIDLLNPASVRVLIDAVYEPHYAHFADRFGKSLAGFFSDEPSLGNALDGPWTTDYGMYDRRLGMPGLSLPFHSAIPEQLAPEGDGLALLPALWYPVREVSPEVRLAYMDTVTALYRDAFCGQLGSWCRAHGAAYIGHIIEDMNAHARLGCSAGHYFRALSGQDMSGIDIVLHQVMPGFAHYQTAASCAGGVADPEFFQYVLAKLGASLSHIEPRMRGRAMCEVFGAYGWAEGAPMMKWLMDFLLVRGVNHFVPHAFSPFFPNPDCPPHFGAEGNDPQFPAFAELMGYVNRASHLLSGAVHQADAALLYHAEGEWMNGDRRMLVQKPAKLLYDDCIDYDILPIDAVCEQLEVRNGRLCLGQESYGCLVVPWAPRLPERFLRAAQRLQEAGGCILFLEAMPENAGFAGEVLPLEGLVSALRRRGLASVCGESVPLVRLYHVKRGGTDLFMLFNESVTETVRGRFQLPCKGAFLRLDLLTGDRSLDNAADGSVSVELTPYQSEFLVFGQEEIALPPARKWRPLRELSPAWEIALWETGRSDCFVPLRATGVLANLTAPCELPDFSGVARYRGSFSLEEAGPLLLDLGQVGETARVLLNGQDLGMRICPPYRFDLDGAVQAGENRLEIQVANTLVHRIKDPFSHYIAIPPTGLMGPVTLWGPA